eukprot:CAMPEP_0201094608 /NCGR_PEP_ID=MMETSP0812-20130820/3013_1 /ASSEMBLY_ACC=CAM_ASM_000668 /TAXON_ID=98059 /ORGANISM="Dinobryon sp., Strain UTEXLB2267" /LENGTH=75 /DNA_ID=CAMNT_0047347377 /DNA_START=125 /DNA_END=353 /DNA_ORIENTATION=+
MVQRQLRVGESGHQVHALREEEPAGVVQVPAVQEEQANERGSEGGEDEDRRDEECREDNWQDALREVVTTTSSLN